MVTPTGALVTHQEIGGFVIEDRNAGQPMFYDARTETSVGGSFAWTPEAVQALRFSRRIDAERFVTKHLPQFVGQITVVPYAQQ